MLHSVSDPTTSSFSWQGKRVFLTGHTGFKGGWLALWLTQLGAEVRGYALAPETTPDSTMCAEIFATVRRLMRR